MKCDVMLTGVGGEGVLTAGVIVARAATYDGNYIRGVQLHGLAQRGGTIPTFVRFGSEKKISSPAIMQANADLILGFEQLEALRSIYYARKEKTTFILNDYPHMPVYSNLLNIPYPSMPEIVKKIKPFAKKVYVVSGRTLAKEKFGEPIYGDLILMGFAVGSGLLPIKKESMKKAIKNTVPRGIEKNLEALEIGFNLAKEKKKFEM